MYNWKWEKCREWSIGKCVSILKPLLQTTIQNYLIIKCSTVSFVWRAKATVLTQWRFACCWWRAWAWAYFSHLFSFSFPVFSLHSCLFLDFSILSLSIHSPTSVTNNTAVHNAHIYIISSVAIQFQYVHKVISFS